MTRLTRTPAFGITVLTPLMLAAAVGAAGPSTPAPAASVQGDDVTPLAAVAPSPPPNLTGPSVVAIARTPATLHVASATTSAPPPAMVVSAPGALRIPAIALSAYRNAEGMMNRALPGCGVSWNLLAGIGRVESGHANNGATDTSGTAVNPIYGPALDGSLPGNETIVASSQLGRVSYARAMGPMQFLPGTWSRFASDGDGDGKADPQNVYDSSLSAARYLCSGGLNLRDQPQVMSAILRYNNSVAYARNVLGWAAAYATGVAPVNLPPITGSVPQMADTRPDARLDAHLVANPEGLGPGLAPADPLPVFSLNQSDVANQLPIPPGPVDGVAQAPLNAPCTIFCITESAPAVPPWGATPPWAPAPWAPAPPPWAPPAPEFAPVAEVPAGVLPGPPAPPVGVFDPAPAPAHPGPPAGPLPGPAA